MINNNLDTSMDNNYLKGYINTHLKNDLRWLFCATASWELPSEKTQCCRHLQLYAEITAFTHARSLFEFFTHTPSRVDDVSCCHYGLTKPLDSELYNTWKDALNKYIMHPTQREEGGNIIAGKHLKNMPLEFAKEILRLWDEFKKQIPDEYKENLTKTRNYAIRRAKEVNDKTKIV